jgi:hypothetical protein
MERYREPRRKIVATQMTDGAMHSRYFTVVIGFAEVAYILTEGHPISGQQPLHMEHLFYLRGWFFPSRVIPDRSRLGRRPEPKIPDRGMAESQIQRGTRAPYHLGTANGPDHCGDSFGESFGVVSFWLDTFLNPSNPLVESGHHRWPIHWLYGLLHCMMKGQR